MTKQIIEDAKQAYGAWKESQPGSYVERALADSIVQDLVPAMIHAMEASPRPIGFAKNLETLELESENE